MGLMYTKTRDQALLATVIKEAATVAREKDCWVGRTAVQKIMYFLGVRGVDTNYKFDIYQYGPFCEQILWDIDALLADGIIQDKSSNPDKFSNYVAGKDIDKIHRLYPDETERCLGEIRQIVNTLVPLKPNELELIATLDYIYRQQIATGLRSDLKKVVVSRFQEIKKDKFPVDYVSNAYDSMVTAHLVQG